MTIRAVLDIGTVSTRLVMADHGGGTYERRSIDTLVGGARLTPAGEVESEPISDEGLTRVGHALDRLADEMAAFGPVESMAAVATESGRRAPNFAAVARLVEHKWNVGVRVLSGQQEAALAFLGATSDPGLVTDAAQVVTFDLGGGSVEVALGPVGALAEDLVTCSLPLSSLGLSSTYITSDPPRPEELSAALSVVELYVDDLVRLMPQLPAALADAGTLVIGTGAIETIAAVEIGLSTDPLNGPGDGPLHGLWLERDGVEEVFRVLATENRQQRAHNPGLPASRVDSIVGGCVVLVEIMRQLGLEGVRISQRGLAHGVLAAEL